MDHEDAFARIARELGRIDCREVSLLQVEPDGQAVFAKGLRTLELDASEAYRGLSTVPFGTGDEGAWWGLRVARHRALCREARFPPEALPAR